MEFSIALHSVFLISLFCSILRVISGAGEVQTESHVAVTVGEAAILPCTFDTTQLVAIEWRRGEHLENSETIIRLFKHIVLGRTEDPRFNLTSDYSLVVLDSVEGDSGLYWCQVTLQGIFQSSSNLSVSPVTPTPGETRTTSPAPPTKPAPEKQTSPPHTIYIIVGCIGGIISLAILVLVCYCCCCKRNTPDGYDKPKPV